MRRRTVILAPIPTRRLERHSSLHVIADVFVSNGALHSTQIFDFILLPSPIRRSDGISGGAIVPGRVRTHHYLALTMTPAGAYAGAHFVLCYVTPAGGTPWGGAHRSISRIGKRNRGSTVRNIFKLQQAEPGGVGDLYSSRVSTPAG